MTVEESRTRYYFSLQYSAIQKTVMRHDRLWSLAGVSQMLSQLNEVVLPATAKKFGDGQKVVAGGGKFTACFKTPQEAEAAKKEIIQTLATTLPMLESQASDIVAAGSLADAKQKGLLTTLADQKRKFRGYGVTYNPHLMVCQECGEYPATHKMKDASVCRICAMARKSLPSHETKEGKGKTGGEQGDAGSTSIERVYQQYISKIRKKHPDAAARIPANFENLFPQPEKGKSGQTNRMAVWLSDTNNMNKKVPIWFNQDDGEITKIFTALNAITVEIIAETLVEVFKKNTWNKWKEENENEDSHEVDYLPFRLVVAGGDDLGLVMDEKYILNFALKFSENHKRKIESSQKANDFLQTDWLKEQAQKHAKTTGAKDKDPDPGPFSFGSAFLVTPVHTPFKKIHEAGEHLMKEAKEKTDRQANSVNWQVLAVDVPDPVPVDFEKPVVIAEADKTNPTLPDSVSGRLSFEEYYWLREFYRPLLSGSKRSNLGTVLVSANKDAGLVEKALIHDAARGDKAAGFLLNDNHFRAADGRLVLARLATLMELLNIKKAGEEA